MPLGASILDLLPIPPGTQSAIPSGLRSFLECFTAVDLTSGWHSARRVPLRLDARRAPAGCNRQPRHLYRRRPRHGAAALVGQPDAGQDAHRQRRDRAHQGRLRRSAARQHQPQRYGCGDRLHRPGSHSAPQRHPKPRYARRGAPLPSQERLGLVGVTQRRLGDGRREHRSRRRVGVGRQHAPVAAWAVFRFVARGGGVRRGQLVRARHSVERVPRAARSGPAGPAQHADSAGGHEFVALLRRLADGGGAGRLALGAIAPAPSTETPTATDLLLWNPDGSVTSDFELDGWMAGRGGCAHDDGLSGSGRPRPTLA